LLRSTAFFDGRGATHAVTVLVAWIALGAVRCLAGGLHARRMLQAYAATGDEVVRETVSRRYLAPQRTIADLTGADTLQVRTFIATGLVVTVSTALALPGKRTDATWGSWLLKLIDPHGGGA
jgi:hypothetical protein